MTAVDDKRQMVEMDELIEKALRWNEWGDGFFSERETLTIAYEDMTANLPGQFSWGLDYLDLPAHTPQRRLRDQNPEPVNPLIANWPEVLARLIDRGFDHFIPA